MPCPQAIILFNIWLVPKLKKIMHYVQVIFGCEKSSQEGLKKNEDVLEYIETWRTGSSLMLWMSLVDSKEDTLKDLC